VDNNFIIAKDTSDMILFTFLPNDQTLVCIKIITIFFANEVTQSVTSASTNIALPEDGVTTPKRVGVILM
jgi:hypothetical protein